MIKIIKKISLSRNNRNKLRGNTNPRKNSNPKSKIRKKIVRVKGRRIILTLKTLISLV
jgi:hypothetical protein